ncbi:MAG: hypothetical protein ABI469_06525 [Gemmatimonadales bacterium]
MPIGMAKRHMVLRLVCATFVAIGFYGNPLVAQLVPEPVMTRFTYAVVSGNDTSWQYVVRTPAHFQSDVVLGSQGAALQIAAATDHAGLVRRLELTVFRFPSGHPEAKWTSAQRAIYELGPDSVFGTVQAARGQQNQRYPAPAGSVIFQWSYVALLEQIVVRARELGVSMAEIPVYFFGTSGYVLPAKVRFQAGSDSVAVSLGQSEFTLVLDKFRRIQSGSARGQEIRHVAPRNVFPADSNITRELRCPDAELRPDLARIRDDPAVRQILDLYPGAGRVDKFRALRNETDLPVCKELLDMFPPQGLPPQLVDLGQVYLMVVGPTGQRAAVGLVSHDLSVAHFTLTSR